MADPDDRHRWKRPAAEFAGPLGHEHAQPRDERRGGGAHRLEVDPIAIRGLAARAHAKVVGGHHDESLRGHVLSEAVAAMPGNVHVPVGARVGASRPADQDRPRRLAIGIGKMNRRGQKRGLLERQLSRHVENQVSGLEHPRRHQDLLRLNSVQFRYYSNRRVFGNVLIAVGPGWPSSAIARRERQYWVARDRRCSSSFSEPLGA